MSGALTALRFEHAPTELPEKIFGDVPCITCARPVNAYETHYQQLYTPHGVCHLGCNRPAYGTVCLRFDG